MTKYASGGRDRTYQVLMVALLEEKKIGLLTQEEFDRRHKEIIHSCYHEDPPPFWEGILRDTRKRS